MGGTIVIAGRLQDVQRWGGEPGKLSGVSIAADPGVTPKELAARVKAALPATVSVKTGEQAATDATSETAASINTFLTPMLLAFAGVSVFVGAFIIFNAFSITVAQRRREFAMLRALGASRRQVLRSVVAEALTLGVARLGRRHRRRPRRRQGHQPAVQGHRRRHPDRRHRARAADDPHRRARRRRRDPGLRPGPGPARDARAAGGRPPGGRGPAADPLHEVHHGDRPGHHRPRRRLARLRHLQRRGDQQPSALHGPRRAAALRRHRDAGQVHRAAGGARHRLAAGEAGPTSGRLARDNAGRNPSRTAATAAALMIGLALVVFIAVFAQAMKGSFGGAIEKSTRAELVVQDRTAFMGVPQKTIRSLDAVQGVDTAAGTGYADLKVKKGGVMSAYAVDPAVFARVWALDWQHGGSDALLGKLDAHHVLLEDGSPLAGKVKAGDSITVMTQGGKKAKLTVLGFYRDQMAFTGMITSLDAFKALDLPTASVITMVRMQDGANVGATQDAVQKALVRLPDAEGHDQG